MTNLIFYRCILDSRHAAGDLCAKSCPQDKKGGFNNESSLDLPDTGGPSGECMGLTASAAGMLLAAEVPLPLPVTGLTSGQVPSGCLSGKAGCAALGSAGAC